MPLIDFVSTLQSTFKPKIRQNLIPFLGLGGPDGGEESYRWVLDSLVMENIREWEIHYRPKYQLLSPEERKSILEKAVVNSCKDIWRDYKGRVSEEPLLRVVAQFIDNFPYATILSTGDVRCFYPSSHVTS